MEVEEEEGGMIHSLASLQGGFPWVMVDGMHTARVFGRQVSYDTPKSDGRE